MQVMHSMTEQSERRGTEAPACRAFAEHVVQSGNHAAAS